MRGINRGSATTGLRWCALGAVRLSIGALLFLAACGDDAPDPAGPPTSTPVDTATATAVPPATATQTSTVTAVAFTPTGTPTGTVAATLTPTGTPTGTVAATVTETPTALATDTPTGIPTGTPTGTVAATFTPTGTPAGTVAATATPTSTPIPIEPSSEVLFSTQGNELDVYDLDSGARDVLIPSTRAAVNGQICQFNDGSGRFITGEDTNQPVERPGWGIFSPDGTLLKKLPLPRLKGEALVPDPVGCALDAEGRLFASAIGTPGGMDGQLIVYFPPTYDESCILEAGVRTPGTLAIGSDGNLYVPESTPPGRVLRYAPPFPDDAVECGTRVPEKSTFIEYTDLVASFGVAEAAGGHWYVSLVVGLGESGPTVREHDEDGMFLRDLFTPGTGGNPAGIALDREGTIYYADLGLDDQFRPQRGGGTVRRIVFDAEGNPSPPVIFADGLTFPDGVAVFPRRPAEWLQLGGSLRRTYANPFEKGITEENVGSLVLKWRYLTDAIITGSPVVTTIDVPGEGPAQVVIFSSWDRNVYALRTDNGSRVWSYERKPQPGASYPFAGSPTVAWHDGRHLVYVPGGMTMYCLDAATGEEIWQFDAGTGCTTCGPGPGRERNQIESSPAVIDGRVIFGMDVDDSLPGKGGLYGVSATDGRLLWYFDLVTSSTCRPFPDENIRRFDGFHTAEQLGLPEDFFATRPGCDFDRTGVACGNVWSSAAVDARRGLFYIASSNCDTDENPASPLPPPPMPPYDEALFAVTFDGDPAWVWRPREVDNDDLAFGAVPNLFEVEIEGALREVVGIGNKDGTYYLLDRDGVNEITGEIEPYWSRNVVPGGPQGGITGSAAVLEGTIYFSTAPGFSVFDPQRPTAHAIRAVDGSIVWQNSDVQPSFAPASVIPGVLFVGGTPANATNVLSRADGRLLRTLSSGPIVAGVASAAVTVDGVVYTGGGVGALNQGPDAFREMNRDQFLSAYCLPGTPGCVQNPCDDGNICTYDYLADGECTSEPAANGIDCPDGAAPTGRCLDGACVPL
jgi:outer membrane protein assembly factor BamB